MQLVVSNEGVVRCVYAEAIDVSVLGTATIRRASHVEPNEHGEWLADLSLVHGPLLGPFKCRSVALLAERVWLEERWLIVGRRPNSKGLPENWRHDARSQEP